MRNLWMRAIAAVLLITGSATSFAAEDASSYPSKDVKVIIPFAAGGGVTIGGRLIVDGLARHLKANFIVENKPGAGGRIGAAIAAREPADGYTLFYAPGAPISVAPVLNIKLDYNPVRDFRPVALMLTAPGLLIVRKSFPAKTFKEFIAYAKKNPGKINFGIQGVGNEFHVSLEKLRQQANVKITAVPYKGGAPAIVDLLAERLDAMFLVPAAIKNHLKSGKLRALATLEPKRVPDFPEIPSVAEEGFPKLVGSPWFGMFAPAATPQPIVDKLAATLLALPKDKPLADKLHTLGYLFDPLGPKQFAAVIDEERHEYKAIAAGGRLDRAN